jgi:hypothetical protein
VHELAVEFEDLVRARDKLASWLDRAGTSGVSEVAEFAHGLERECAEVEAALTYESSSGSRGCGSEGETHDDSRGKTEDTIMGDDQSA